MIITANNIETLLCIIGKKEDYKIGYLPKIDKSLIILNSLINKSRIDANDSYKDVINDYYEKYKASKTRKTRINNDMIIDSVKKSII
mgnify:CR=1 FL=1